MPDKIENPIAAEYLRVARLNFHSIKSYADKSLAQLKNDELSISFGEETNTIAILIQHISGNLVSRFTDFLISDGEKTDRNRDLEFEVQKFSKNELLEKWEASWKILFDLLDSLSEEDILTKTVYVRNEPHSVIEAINRQVWHYSFHVGQIVSFAKQIKGSDWKNLSMPKRKSK